MSGRCRTHRERHERLDNEKYDEKDILPKCWKSGWEYKIPEELLTYIKERTGVSAEDPNKTFRLCVMSGYTKEHRANVTEFARRKERVNILRDIYVGHEYVIGRFFNGSHDMYGFVINNTHGIPTANPAESAKSLDCFNMQECGVSLNVRMTTYIEKM